MLASGSDLSSWGFLAEPGTDSGLADLPYAATALEMLLTCNDRFVETMGQALVVRSVY